MVERKKTHTESLNIDYELFLKCVDRLAERLREKKHIYDGIYGIPRGGLVVAVYLSHRLGIPIVMNRSSPHTLIVDDILDTGDTLSNYPEHDKVVLVAKSTGLDRCPTTMYALNTADNFWVYFPWEVE